MFLLLLVSLLLAQTPSVGTVTLTPDSHAVAISYPCGQSYAVSGATWANSGGTYTMVFTIGTHVLQASNQIGVVGTVTNTGSSFDTARYGDSSYTITSVTSTTVTVQCGNCSADPGTYVSGGTLYLITNYFVQYGLSSGNYLWESMALNSYVAAGVCEVPIGGLVNGTAYHFQANAMLGLDEQNMGSSSDVTATPNGNSTPAVANLPASWVTYPDTSAYVTVTLEPDGSGECAAVSDVNTPPAGYTIGSTWNGYPTNPIATGHTLTWILDPTKGEFWYGTVFNINGQCTIPNNRGGGNNGEGYYLPATAADPLATGGSIDASNHRWIIFQTTPSTKVPPNGVRPTVSQANANYASFLCNQPTGSSGAVGAQGCAFEMNLGQVHHFIFSNLKFYTSAATNQTAIYAPFILTGNANGGQLPPYPEYLQWYGCYFHGPDRLTNLQQGLPYQEWQIIGASSQVVMQGNIFDDFWPYTIGTTVNHLSGGLYFLDTNNNPQTTNQLPQNVAIDNNMFGNGMGQTLYLEVNNPLNPNTFQDFTVTHNAFYWASSGSQNAYSYATYTGGGNCRNQVEMKRIIRGNVTGNYLNGNWACQNPGEAILIENPVDLTVRSNFLTNVATPISTEGYGNIYGYPIASNRVAVTNNVATKYGRGLWSAGSGGAYSMFFEPDTGIQNLNFSHNLTGTENNYDIYIPATIVFFGWTPYAGFTYQNNVVDVDQGGGAQGYVMVQDATGIQRSPTVPLSLTHPNIPIPSLREGIANSVSDNWLTRMGTVLGVTDGATGNGIGGVAVVNLGSGYSNSPITFPNSSMCSGGSMPTASTISTVAAWSSSTFYSGGAVVAYSGIIYQAAAGNSGATPTAGYPWVVAQNGGTGAISQVDQAGDLFGSNCSTSLLAANPPSGGSSGSFRVGYGLTPQFTWGGNQIIGGFSLTDSQITTNTQYMPSGDVYQLGGSYNARMQNAGFGNFLNGDFRCTSNSTSSCAAGVNITQMESELGIVSNIRVNVSASAVQLNYTAPDMRQCYVDISTNSGSSWTRQSDGGGTRNRSNSFTGLSASINGLYRVLCYFDQSDASAAGWFSFNSDPSNLQTDGTFTTLASGTRNAAIPFSLSSAAFPGATSTTVTLTAIDGTHYSNTCSSSPCVVSSVPVGDYAFVETYSGGGKTWSSDMQTISIR